MAKISPLKRHFKVQEYSFNIKLFGEATHDIYLIRKTLETLAILLFWWHSQENLGLGLYTPELDSKSHCFLALQVDSPLRGSVLTVIKGE